MSYDFKGFTLPEYMESGIIRYVEKGILPGDFLLGILTNDLKRTVSHANAINLRCIPVYLGYFFNNVPGNCWGSIGAIKYWTGLSQEERTSILAKGTYKSLKEF